MAMPSLCRPKPRFKIKRIWVHCVRVMEEGDLDFISTLLEDCLNYSVQFCHQKDAYRLETTQR